MENKTEHTIFCENVKYLRKKHNLSKKEMAKRLGIGVKSLSTIESGIMPHRLGSSVLVYIYYHFGITPSNIFVPISEEEE